MKFKDEAKHIIAISLGGIGVSLLVSIGIALIVEEIWIGIVPLVLGYELARYVFLFMIKYTWRKT